MTTGSSFPEAGAGEVAAGPAVVSAGARRVSTARVAVALALAAAVSIAALRVTPQVWGDPGVWLSVAARLLDGDRLYADVFDNKDPFFFYS